MKILIANRVLFGTAVHHWTCSFQKFPTQSVLIYLKAYEKRYHINTSIKLFVAVSESNTIAHKHMKVAKTHRVKQRVKPRTNQLLFNIVISGVKGSLALECKLKPNFQQLNTMQSQTSQ